MVYESYPGKWGNVLDTADHRDADKVNERNWLGTKGVNLTYGTPKVTPRPVHDKEVNGRWKGSSYTTEAIWHQARLPQAEPQQGLQSVQSAPQQWPHQGAQTGKAGPLRTAALHLPSTSSSPAGSSSDATSVTVSDGSTPEEKDERPLTPRQRAWLEADQPGEVLASVKRDMMARLGVRPQVDVFGSDHINFKEHWAGKNKDYSKWANKGTLYLNAPPRSLPVLAAVIRQFNLKAMIWAPSWGEREETKSWYQRLWSMTSRYFKYKKGTKIWAGEQPLEWDMVIMLVQGSNNLAKRTTQGKDKDKDISNVNMIPIDQELQETGSWARRKRRKKQRQTKRQRKQGSR
jgi:hypothetical protein